MILEEYCDFSPEYLLHFMMKEKYDDLINNGMLSLKEIGLYRNLSENNNIIYQHDRTEGKSEYYIEKYNCQHSFILGFDVFLFCTCLPACDKEEMKKRFRTKFCVKIKNVKLLLENIDKYLGREYPKEEFQSICLKVTYNKGNSKSRYGIKLSDLSEEEKFEFIKLIVFQKPPNYSKEYEFRFAFRCLSLDRNLLLSQRLKVKIDDCENIFDFLQ